MSKFEIYPMTEDNSTETVKNFGQSNSNHQVTNYGSFVVDYIEDLKTEITKLAKENTYFQSDAYLEKILPVEYVEELEEKVESLNFANEKLKEENKKLEEENRRLRQEKRNELSKSSTFGGYTSSYVKGLEDELTRLATKNAELQSPEYKDKLTKHYINKKELMERKINLLCSLIQEISYDCVDREDILLRSKTILESD